MNPGESTAGPMQQSNEYEIAAKLEALIAEMHAKKPNDRSALDRRYAVTITELEKAYAYFWFFGVAFKEG